jgi:anti-sigma regulatory factor (Ser/Thr protein kinase)
MNDEPEATNGSALSLARYPGPACSYTFTDGEPVLQTANDSFVELCAAQSGDVLAGALEPLQFCGTEPNFERETQVCVQRAADGDQYDVQVIPPDSHESGYLLFTPAENEGCDPVGVDRVASVISHDLRNPLDVARARLRAGRELDSDEHLEHVAQAHDRMERIIQDVLTLARGEDVVDPDETVDLGAVAADAWETVETNGAELEVVCDLPETKADRDRVSRLFENLFRNAVEHSSESNATADGHTHVVVGSHENGFYVADDGPGIDPTERERVFEPGYSTSDHGTGLGLAIVKQIAQLHGWSINVTSSGEGGARFEITGVDPN